MHQNFTESIEFYQAAYKMHLTFGGSSEFCRFHQDFIPILQAAETAASIIYFTAISMQINFSQIMFQGKVIFRVLFD